MPSDPNRKTYAEMKEEAVQSLIENQKDITSIIMNTKQQRHDEVCEMKGHPTLNGVAICYCEDETHFCTCTERVEVDQKRFEELIAKAITPPQEPLRERKHDCEWTHDEIMGCTICASGYMSFEDFKKRVDYHSWRITDLREQLASSRTAVIARVREEIEELFKVQIASVEGNNSPHYNCQVDILKFVLPEILSKLSTLEEEE